MGRPSASPYPAPSGLTQVSDAVRFQGLHPWLSHAAPSGLRQRPSARHSGVHTRCTPPLMIRGTGIGRSDMIRFGVCLLVLAAGSRVAAQDVDSGPAKGAKVPELKVYAVSGPVQGETVDYAAQ